MSGTEEKPGFAVNIRPEVTILSVLRHLNYRPWFALAEFVDNSLQSFLQNRDVLASSATSKLRVDIEWSGEMGGRIVIRDNAAGIRQQDFPRAFRPAELPPDRSGLSEFGMGMKSAACWFARDWTVRTSACDDAVERTIAFDIDSVVVRRLEDLHVNERPVTDKAHFTEITLTGLYHPPKGRTIGKIKEHLASIYRTFLRDGLLELYFDGEPLKFEAPAILGAPNYRNTQGEVVAWRKEIDFDFGLGQRVTGFAALRETASTSYAGFALFRRGRLIEGSADETYRPIQIFGNSNSYRYQRLFGELSLDGFDVSHTKDGFRWEEHEDVFLEFLEAELKAAPLNLLDQAEGHRARPTRKSVESRAQVATDHVAHDVETLLPPVLRQEADFPSTPEPTPALIPKSSLQASERTVPINDGKNDWEIVIRTSVDPSIGDWLRIGKQSNHKDGGREIRRLVVDVSLDHPFVVQFLGPGNENVELFIRFATGIALSLVMASYGGAGDPSFVLHHLNSLLRNALSLPLTNDNNS
jgi:Histidine kinase-, DNA gyrase B-, and HSP90-like ATPase